MAKKEKALRSDVMSTYKVSPHLGRHIHDINVLEQTCYGTNAWDYDRISKFLESSRGYCAVATYGKEVVGACFYELGPAKSVRVLRITVKDDQRRKKVGTGMIRKIESLRSKLRPVASAVISEYDLSSQLFFRKVGWRCISTLPNQFGSGIDGYIFHSGRIFGEESK